MLRLQRRHATFSKIPRESVSLLFVVSMISLVILVGASISYAKTSRSDDPISLNDITQGTLLLRTTSQNNVSPAPSLTTKAHITVTGLIARTTVRQEFENPGLDWAEGIYVFPLPETAAVDHLRMYIGERTIEGIIKERTKAKKIYAKAKQEGQRASLIEQERPNMFTTSVANIGPKERITIEIEYQETVKYHRGEFSLRFPMVVGPRYIPGSQEPIHENIVHIDGHGWARNTYQVPDASRISPPVQNPDLAPLNPVTLTLDLAPGFPLAHLASTYHDILKTTNGKNHHTITLKERTVPADRDFELTWKPKNDHTPKAAIFTEQHNGETYMMIMVVPPADAFADQVTLPRDVTFVIDTSGSMHGISIEQAKLALQLALTRLKSQDRFNIIQFNNKTEALFPGSQSATSRRIQEATRYVQSLVAEGGTEMLPALERALKRQDTTTYLRQVIFMTDGQVGNETQLFHSIQQSLAHTRLFTVGIGSAPNSYFMRNAARFGRGTFTYIGNTIEVQNKMDQLFQKLEHPVITNIELQLPVETRIDVVPKRVPDLYLGEPLIVVVRSPGLLDQAKVTGKIGERDWETTLTMKDTPQRQGLAVYWARQKISALMDTSHKRGEKDSVRTHVTDIALAHHLVSRYTSLVAVDVTPSRPSDQLFSTHAIKTNLPHGQDFTAIFGLSAGATSGPWHLTIGLLLLLLASASFQWARTRI